MKHSKADAARAEREPPGRSTDLEYRLTHGKPVIRYRPYRPALLTRAKLPHDCAKQGVSDGRRRTKEFGEMGWVRMVSLFVFGRWARGERPAGREREQKRIVCDVPVPRV